MMMNKDQVQGKLKELAGEAQEHLGRIVGSKKLEAKGHARELEGRIQKGVGNLKETAEDALSDTTRKSNR